MPARLLAVLTLANPALLWGAAACTIPIAIHLFMRAKPRRQLFPAMQLLIAVKAGSVREHRLRNLLLLLVRMLAIALLVAALARPVSRGSWLAARSRGPTAAAFVIDDSASMCQRFAGQTRLAKGRGWAGQLLNDSIRFPAGSSFAILSSGYALETPRWVEASSEAGRTLSSIRDEAHDRSLGAAIDRASGLLSTAKSGRRELYIVTDNTLAAWADATTGRWASLTDTAVFILDAGDTERENARLIGLRTPGTVVAPRAPVRITCTLESGERGTHTHVDALLDGVVVARSEPISLAANESREVAIALPGMEPGAHVGELRIAGPDVNLVDDSLFFALEARTPPAVQVISTTSDLADELEARRVAALLAPPTMAEDRRPFQVEVQTDAAGGIRIRHGSAGTIIWIGIPNLTHSQRSSFDRFVKDGGRLLVLPSASLNKQSDRWSALPGHWSRVVTLDRPIGIRWALDSRGGGAQTPEGLPFDLAFTRREGIDSLAYRQVTQHADLTPDPNSQRLAELDNGQPAILARTSGSGVIVQFAFRLDPEWGDLGSRAAAAMVMFHGMVGHVGGTSTRASQVRCGESAVLDCGALADSDVLVHHERGKRDESAPEKRKLGAGGRFPFRANSAGVYSIHNSAGQTLAACAVNNREGETLADRTLPERIRAAFAAGAAMIISDPSSLETPTTAVAGDREWDGYAFLALLALLAAEILFANRFYRSR